MQGACVLLLLGLRLQLSLGLVPVEEEDPAFWNRQAAQALDVAKKLQPLQTAAKNVILFLGDGMGVSTVTAAQILKGQMAGKPGPETPLAGYGPVPIPGSVQDIQRGQTGARQCRHRHRLPVRGQGQLQNHRCKCSRLLQPVQHDTWERGHVCDEPGQESREVSGSGDHHQGAARLPSGAYAHTVNRNWYSDADLPADAQTNGCQDIAAQLVYNMDIDVILGGDRMYMFPKGTPDPEYPHDANQTGVRGQVEPGAGVAGRAPGSPVCVEPHCAPSGGQ